MTANTGQETQHMQHSASTSCVWRSTLASLLGALLNIGLDVDARTNGKALTASFTHYRRWAFSARVGPNSGPSNQGSEGRLPASMRMLSHESSHDRGTLREGTQGQTRGES